MEDCVLSKGKKGKIEIEKKRKKRKRIKGSVVVCRRGGIVLILWVCAGTLSLKLLEYASSRIHFCRAVWRGAA